MRVNNNVAIREVITSGDKDNESHYSCDCGYNAYISLGCRCEGCQSPKEHYVTCPGCGAPLIVVDPYRSFSDEDYMIRVQKEAIELFYDDSINFEARIGLICKLISSVFVVGQTDSKDSE